MVLKPESAMVGLPAKEVDDAELGCMRWCPRCNEYWPADLEFFFAQKGRGLHSWCKACFLQAQAARPNRKGGRWYAKHRIETAQKEVPLAVHP